MRSFRCKRHAPSTHKNLTPDLDDRRPESEPTDLHGGDQVMISMYNAMTTLRVMVENTIDVGSALGSQERPFGSRSR